MFAWSLTQAVDAVDDSQRRAVIDRYVASCFAGFARALPDLQNPTHAIDVARTLLDEGRGDLAQEALAFAIEAHPLDKGLRLACLEIAFRERDAHAFAILARRFRRAIGAAPEWAEIERLGHALAPGLPIFAAAADAAAAWPEAPEWLDVPPPLAAQVLASQLHHGFVRAAAAGCCPTATVEVIA